MIVSLSAMTITELDLAASHLSYTASFLRSTGHYSLAAQLISRRNEINQHVLRREADHRQFILQQLSIVPPGAYDDPAA
jgi:hypothetical protein